MEINGQTSDGYHTFDELYSHRMFLFAALLQLAQKQSKTEVITFKSKLHDDGTMFPNYFIVGVKTPEGYFTYHYHEDHWDLFDVIEVEKAPEWDGHKSDDVVRLLSLVNGGMLNEY